MVAIPTEALYMLVADPFNLHAVGRVFAAKGRETHRSLPLLVGGPFMAEELAKELNSRFHIAGAAFLAGAADHHRAGFGQGAAQSDRQYRTAGAAACRVRAWRRPLLDWLDQPLIATSANISGHPTCRSGIEVFGMMDGRVDLVLDGGSLRGRGRNDGGYHRALLESDQGRRHHRKRDRERAESVKISRGRFCRRLPPPVGKALVRIH